MTRQEDQKLEKIKLFRFLRNLGLVVGYAIISILIVLAVSSAFSEILNFNDNLSIGIPLLLVLYFWTGYFLEQRDKKPMKIAGFAFFILALFFNILFLFTHYPTQTEFIITTALLLLPLVEAVFIIFQRPSIPALLIWSAIVIFLTMGVA